MLNSIGSATPKKVQFSLLNEINGVQNQSNLINSKKSHDAKIIIEKLTINSPLKEPKKIKFLDKDVKGAANKANSKPNTTKHVTIPKEFNFSKRFDKPLRVKDYPTRKSQGIRV